jgi:hypothetical protein
MGLLGRQKTPSNIYLAHTEGTYFEDKRRYSTIIESDKYRSNVSFILESDKYRGNVSFILESDKHRSIVSFINRRGIYFSPQKRLKHGRQNITFH